MSNEKGTHLGEGSRPVSVPFLQVLYNVGIIPAREQYRDINKGVVRSGSSPRVPCGARLLGESPLQEHHTFQSTRPVRGATWYDVFRAARTDVSIHAPRAGRDQATTTRHTTRYEFQSTRPVRGATLQRQKISCHSCVSIHAPRAGRDRYAENTSACP